MTSTVHETSTRSRTQRPKLYQVVFVNDDFTPMEFVVLILEKIFGKNYEQAEAITLDIHRKGRGVVGQYTLEIAETKVAQVMGLAMQHEHPLACQAEPI